MSLYIKWNFIIIGSNSFINKNKIESIQDNNFKKLKDRYKLTPYFKILQEINIKSRLYNQKIEIYKRKKKIIHITVSINNNKNYKYIILVSMYSLLLNCYKDKTFVIYHILCTPDFNESSITIFKSLLNKFSQNVEMIFYNMGNLFKNRKNIRYSEAAYYRILTPIIIDSDRVIHLDGDTLVFSDLSEMYNLDFQNNYVLGIYDFISKGVDYLGLKSNIYINSGAILLNLKKMREDNKVLELLKLTDSNVTLKNVDQTAFNYLLYPKIGRLPSKYVVFNFEDKSDIIFYINCLRTKISLEEIEKALKNPTIIHHVICSPKPWSINSTYLKGASACTQRHNCSCKKYFDIWHSFANQTEYYEEISEFTGIKKLKNRF